MIFAILVLSLLQTFTFYFLRNQFLINKEMLEQGRIQMEMNRLVNKRIDFLDEKKNFINISKFRGLNCED